MASDRHGAGILQTAHDLMAVEAHLAQVLPPGLTRYSKAALIDRQRLTISVPSPAHAARLRQLAPTLAAHLRGKGWLIEDIIVRIDIGQASWMSKPALRQAEGLDDTALASFAELQGNLRPGPLAEAVERLLRHHRQPR